MSHSNRRQEKVFPRISVGEADEWGAQTHYCTARRERIGLHVEGRTVVRRLFCPLCGVLVAMDPVEHHRAGVIELARFDGPRCRHGRPDLRCLDVTDTDTLVQLQLAFGAIREYGAAQMAARYGCAPTVAEWVRVCFRCRSDIAAKNRPLLRYELRLLAHRLAEELRAANSDLLKFAREADELQFLIAELDEPSRGGPSGDRRPDGFVYLISGRDALKIGFSERHPRESRLHELQVASPDALRLAGLILGNAERERQLHRQFARYRIRGEWFANNSEILEYFRTHGVDVS